MINESSFTNQQKPERESAEKRAFDFLSKTLGEEVTSLKDFPDQLFHQIKNLKRYRDIHEHVKDLPKEDIPIEVFNLIKRESDEQKNEYPGNGVLINSMKKGNLECAGRTMVASEIFSDLGVGHSVAHPHGHSMIIYESDDDTLVYFDANNDLLFSFPKKALKGYKGTGVKAECVLEDYQARDKDFFDGSNGAMRHMMILPPRDGIINSYLDNARAALKGLPEFDNDSIDIDSDAADVISDFREVLLKDNIVEDDFHERGEEEVSRSKKEKEVILNEAKQMIENDVSKEEFVEKFLSNRKLWRRFPYLQKSENRSEFLKRLYKDLKQRN